jgi:hypothetical protein
MNKSIFIQVTVCALFLILILIFSNKEGLVANHSEMNKMIEVVEQNNGTVTEWSILAREELPKGISLSELEQMTKDLQKDYTHLNWDQVLEHDRYDLQGSFSSNNLDYKEQLKITADVQDTTIQGFIIYELKGTKWNKEIQDIVSAESVEIMSNLFQKTSKIFSCVKGVFNDKMDSVVYERATELNNGFNGKIIEKLKEENFISLTVNSPHFSNEMPTENGAFDLQIAIREDSNNKSTFVIGTPLLTIEY